MIVLHPVLEILTPADFDLWPVASGLTGFLPLSGALDPVRVGTAVMRIADCNDYAPETGDPRPADPLGSFLHGLLTLDDLYIAGGLQVTDTTTGTVLQPGCCNGLEERGDWLEVLDGEGWATFGHSPSPDAHRVGDVVRLTVDANQDDGLVIELPADRLRELLADAERDLTDFLHLAASWADHHLPDHATPVTAALARALDLPAPPRP
ncbi:hypothetical protein [Streptomyces sp. NPDC048659]|uniref:hypothetical protein n=1 Tax=Streptomyces sp. NPDC048659 TaxID=3155489 RepID=UPI0034476C9A